VLGHEGKAPSGTAPERYIAWFEAQVLAHAIAKV